MRDDKNWNKTKNRWPLEMRLFFRWTLWGVMWVNHSMHDTILNIKLRYKKTLEGNPANTQITNFEKRRQDV